MRGRMSKLHVYTICVYTIYIFGPAIAAPVSNTSDENQSREFVAEDNPGPLEFLTVDNPGPREFATIDNPGPREYYTITQDTPIPSSRYIEKRYHPRELIFEIIESKDAAQTKDVLVIDEIDVPVFNDDDMEVAETHIFRPLFRYRAQLERRKRLGQSGV